MSERCKRALVFISNRMSATSVADRLAISERCRRNLIRFIISVAMRFVLSAPSVEMSYEICFVYSAAMKVTAGIMNCAATKWCSETISTAWMGVT